MRLSLIRCDVVHPRALCAARHGLGPATSRVSTTGKGSRLELEDAKAAKARLQKWIDDRQKELAQQALAKQGGGPIRQASSLRPDALYQKGGEIQSRFIALTQKYEHMQREAQTKERLEMSDPDQDWPGGRAVG